VLLGKGRSVTSGQCTRGTSILPHSMGRNSTWGGKGSTGRKGRRTSCSKGSLEEGRTKTRSQRTHTVWLSIQYGQYNRKGQLSGEGQHAVLEPEYMGVQGAPEQEGHTEIWKQGI